jgi:hypothetical protein
MQISKMNHQFLTKLFIFSFAMGGLLSMANAADEFAPTPYRPTLSNPAELSVPGWLELEVGWLDNRAGENRQSLPYLAKLAFNEDWGVMLGGELWIRDHLEETTSSGLGDTGVILKHRMPTSDKNQNFGIEAGVQFPTAKHGLGEGKTDYSVNGIYSLDFASEWRLDANLSATKLGSPDEGASSAAFLWATALSKQLGSWTLAGEVSRTHQAGAPNSMQWLTEASYQVHPHVVLDAGFSIIQQTQGNGHTLFFGATWLADKLF